MSLEKLLSAMDFLESFGHDDEYYVLGDIHSPNAIKVHFFKKMASWQKPWAIDKDDEFNYLSKKELCAFLEGENPYYLEELACLVCDSTIAQVVFARMVEEEATKIFGKEGIAAGIHAYDEFQEGLTALLEKHLPRTERTLKLVREE